MATELLTERYATDLHGVLNCYDRIILAGHVHPWCYDKGMTGYLYQHNLLIFDYAQKFAAPLRDTIRANAEAIAQDNGLTIEFVRKSQAFRKEDRIQKILHHRGDHSGLVHIFSAMETCLAYKPWHDKSTGRTFVKLTSGKCLHYYFYFIDEELGLCYMRVPTWSPFRLQFYFNGHNWLAHQLKQAQIGFKLCDNTFLQIDDFEYANQCSGTLDLERLHHKLDQFAQYFCPVVASMGLQYHWSIMQAEYATDLIFKHPSTLQACAPLLLETLIQAVKPADVATFLGRKLHGNYQGEIGNRYNVRWLGRRIKHQMGPVAIKMYDKFNLVLRIETTVNNVSFFRQYRRINHRDGSTSMKWAPMKKTLYSLAPLQEAVLSANHRYLKFISEIQTPEVGVEKLRRLAETRVENQHRYKGFNLFAEEDVFLFRSLLRGEFFIRGFTSKDLRQHLSHKNSGQITRLLKRLRVHGLIKKVGRHYRYYLTDFGRQVIAMALKLREMVVIPELSQA